MTDEIIIDGVDVSGCDFLSKEDDYCSYSGEYRAYKGQCGCSDEEMCKDHPNCFYKKVLKQLKRKEQECEELKEENNQLQKNCQICECFINGIPCKSLRDMDYDLQNVINQRDNYKQALDKIEQYRVAEINDEDGEATDTILQIINATRG